MSNFWRKFLLWFFAVIITLSAVVYQRITGPTNPKRISFIIEGESFNLRIPRSLEIEEPVVKIKESPPTGAYKLSLLWRRYLTNDSFEKVECSYSDGYYQVELPPQPPAGKIEYSLIVESKENPVAPIITEPVVLRFKGGVASSLLIPHIILMFLAMFFSNVAGLTTPLKVNWGRFYAFVTLITLFIGGLVLGPLVQKAAFGDYWTGWPVGGDLTDTKTLFAFLVWLFAFSFGRKKWGRYLYIVAAVVMLLVYTIPHSSLGSSYDYDKGEVVTGKESSLLIESPFITL